MKFMNEYDIGRATLRFSRGDTPNRLRLAEVIENLMLWANRNSDGWAYWPKPCRAARKAIELVESRTNAENDEQEQTDATDAEVKAALVPIKSFLTRHGVAHSEVL